jgi:hypothetical protein
MLGLNFQNFDNSDIQNNKNEDVSVFDLEIANTCEATNE